MTTLTIRELRQSWPAAERALEEDEEILITRDGKAVAKLIRYEEPSKKRPRFDPAAHRARIKKIFGNKKFSSSGPGLSARRADRTFDK